MSFGDELGGTFNSMTTSTSCWSLTTRDAMAVPVAKCSSGKLHHPVFEGAAFTVYVLTESAEICLGDLVLGLRQLNAARHVHQEGIVFGKLRPRAGKGNVHWTTPVGGGSAPFELCST